MTCLFYERLFHSLKSLIYKPVLPVLTVEPAPGVDLEGLEVARECLQEVFKLDSFRDDDQTKPDSLVDIFSSLGTNKLQDNKANFCHGSISTDVPSSSLTQNCAKENLAKASKSLVLPRHPYLLFITC